MTTIWALASRPITLPWDQSRSSSVPIASRPPIPPSSAVAVRSPGLLTATALLGGIGGLLAMGTLLDRDWSHGSVMGLLASAQIVVIVVVLRWYPETAHQELEALNPLDATASAVAR